MQFLYLQDTQFLCKVCGDRFFKTRYDITRHLEEQHGGFAYKCNICNRVYNRAGKHASCRAGRDEMLLFHRQTGARGVEAQQQLEEYYRTKLPQLWEAVPVENRAFPQPRDLPHQNFHRSRLEGLYPKNKYHYQEGNLIIHNSRVIITIQLVQSHHNIHINQIWTTMRMIFNL